MKDEKQQIAKYTPEEVEAMDDDQLFEIAKSEKLKVADAKDRDELEAMLLSVMVEYTPPPEKTAPKKQPGIGVTTTKIVPTRGARETPKPVIPQRKPIPDSVPTVMLKYIAQKGTIDTASGRWQRGVCKPCGTAEARKLMANFPDRFEWIPMPDEPKPEGMKPKKKPEKKPEKQEKKPGRKKKNV